MTAKKKGAPRPKLGTRKQTLRKQGEITEADLDRAAGGGVVVDGRPIKCGLLSTQY